MTKGADAFRSIGEVSQLVGVPPHVLRYWETQFAQLTPVKRADGRRYYRPEDLHLAAGICELLRDDGMTTRGAARLIALDKGAEVRARGRARLPERFRGEADTTAAGDGGPIAQGAAEADETMAKRQDAAGKKRMSAPRRGKPAAPSGRPEPEAAVPVPDGLADLPTAAAPVTDAAAVDQDNPAPRQSDGTSPPALVGDEAAPDAGESSHLEADETQATVAAAAVSSDGIEADDTSPETPVLSATAAPVASGQTAAAGADSPADEQSPRQTEATPPTNRAEGDTPPAPGRPAPAANDLPLFPGLAPAAPPPGVWLPRLAAAADALRRMDPPRRPTARMQHLRDRIAALIDAGA